MYQTYNVYYHIINDNVLDFIKFLYDKENKPWNEIVKERFEILIDLIKQYKLPNDVINLIINYVFIVNETMLNNNYILTIIKRNSANQLIDFESLETYLSKQISFKQNLTINNPYEMDKKEYFTEITQEKGNILNSLNKLSSL